LTQEREKGGRKKYVAYAGEGKNKVIGTQDDPKSGGVCGERRHRRRVKKGVIYYICGGGANPRTEQGESRKNILQGPETIATFFRRGSKEKGENATALFKGGNASIEGGKKTLLGGGDHVYSNYLYSFSKESTIR